MYIRKGSPDVLYLVKPSEENEELKYSLRSLKNLNHGNVFIAGYKPSWVSKRIHHIATEQAQEKYQNVQDNLLSALNDPRLGDDFILMNDDFFVMKPTKQVPTLRRRHNIAHYIELFSKLDPDSYYVKTMRDVEGTLARWGVATSYSYELHAPMVFNKKKLLDLLNKLPNGRPIGHTKTLYGNYYTIGGRPVADVKVISDEQDISFDQQFLSTIDESFSNGAVGNFIRKKLAKVLVFSHAKDPDGLLSVILAQLAFAEVEYVLTNNPQADILEHLAKTDITAYEYIIIADIYPGRQVLEMLPSAYWFDDKQHSIDKIAEHHLTLPNATIATELDGRPTSASELLFRWLVSEHLITHDPANFVEYIRKMDTWDFDDCSGKRGGVHE